MVKNIKQLVSDLVEAGLYKKLNSDKSKSKYEILVLLVHALLVQDNFRCVGLKEDEHVEPKDKNINLPEGWNSQDGYYGFKYKHFQSSFSFVVKFITMGNKILVCAIALEEQKQVLSVEIDIGDFVDIDQIQNILDSYVSNTDTNTDEQKITDDVFKCFKKVNELEKLIQDKISKVLVPQPGDKSESSQSTTSSTTNQQPNPYWSYQPPPQRPHGSFIDDEDDDPLRIGPPRRPQPNFGQPPFGTGGNDLYPSYNPFPLLPNRPHNTGGSQVGPDHPSFGSNLLPPRRGGPPNPEGGYIPARFDPYGPGPIPGSGSGRGRGQGRGRGGNNNSFGPDNDQLNPPGFGNNNPYFF